jgi:hypothetical protein
MIVPDLSFIDDESAVEFDNVRVLVPEFISGSVTANNDVFRHALAPFLPPGESGKKKSNIVTDLRPAMVSGTRGSIYRSGNR